MRAPDDVRWACVKQRDKTFAQTTEQDVIEKGLLLPQRINDMFLAYADRIDFYSVMGSRKMQSLRLRGSEIQILLKR